MVEGELEVRLRLLRSSLRMQPYHWCDHLRLCCFAHGCGCNHVPVLGHHVPAYLSDVMRLID